MCPLPLPRFTFLWKKKKKKHFFPLCKKSHLFSQLTYICNMQVSLVTSLHLFFSFASQHLFFSLQLLFQLSSPKDGENSYKSCELTCQLERQIYAHSFETLHPQAFMNKCQRGQSEGKTTQMNNKKKGRKKKSNNKSKWKTILGKVLCLQAHIGWSKETG